MHYNEPLKIEISMNAFIYALAVFVVVLCAMSHCGFCMRTNERTRARDMNRQMSERVNKQACENYDS